MPGGERSSPVERAAQAQPAPERRGPQPDVSEQAQGEGVGLGAGAVGPGPLALEERSVLLPGPEEQRGEPVVEEVEPVAQGVPIGASLVPVELEQQLGVVPGQDAVGAGQAEERLDQGGGMAGLGGRVELAERTRREAERRERSEPDHLRQRGTASPHPRPVGLQGVEEPDRLEEVEGERLFVEPVDDLRRALLVGGGHRIDCSPALGGHVLIGSSAVWVRATSRQNELIDT